MSHYEDIVIGCILSGEKDILYRVDEDDFTTPVAKKIYMAARSMDGTGRSVDIVSIHESLGGSVDFEALTIFTNGLSPSLRFSAVDAVKRARAIREAKAFNPSDYEAEELPHKLMEVAATIRGFLNYDAHSMVDILAELKKQVPKHPTGFKRLDSILDGGIERGAVFTISGVAGDGKTALATHMTSNALQAGKNVHFVTLEMQRAALVRRVMASYWDKTADEVNNNLDDAIQMAGSLTTSDTIVRLSDVIGSMSKHLDADIIFIDYLQSIRDTNYKNDRVSEMESVMGTITNFAREFEIPVVLLSQFSRDYKSDKGDPPQMYQLKGSSSIEQASHYVAMLHNPNAKDESRETDDKIFVDEAAPDSRVSSKDERICFIRKNRNGRIGAVKFQFDKPKSSFKEDSFFD